MNYPDCQYKCLIELKCIFNLSSSFLLCCHGKRCDVSIMMSLTWHCWQAHREAAVRKRREKVSEEWEEKFSSRSSVLVLDSFHLKEGFYVDHSLKARRRYQLNSRDRNIERQKSTVWENRRVGRKLFHPRNIARWMKMPLLLCQNHYLRSSHAFICVQW